MLTRRVRIQVLVFAVVALSIVAYVGASYVGLDRLFGQDGYVVRLQLADGGGIFTNGEVTYRGVAVGRVGELRLTDDGMEADLLIDADAPPIPASARAVVANRSAIGEQYVDLQPRSEDGPFLVDGAVIPRESTTLPLPVATVLGNLSALNESVPTDALRTVVDELYAATRDTGPSLQVLLDSSMALTETAAAHLPETITLINDGATVLRTQVDSSAAWRSFSADAKLFAAELARSDGDLRALIGAAPRAATQLSGLLKDTDPGLAVLLANLLTTARVFELRTAGLEHLLVVAPQAVAATSTAITPDGGHLSLALTFFDPEPCEAGYETTPRRQGEDPTPAPLNLDARCTVPGGDPRLVRGSQHLPDAAVPPAATPGGTLAGPLGLPPLPLVSTTLEELLWLPS
ncbi:MAG TPA: MlaD family protein [Actinophytocola sp.]|uniref:MlaD family protein n=1 Tax=Actinophytocola sp. TaxID=1872138 RepID=UPI002DDD9896|nr:MlaD family protein [Actinophytocola sp.]HEV2778076.1 MlaD family protein [Actinophytocola sp.]